MQCPACGKCLVLPAEEVLAGISDLYMACRDCFLEPNLDKGRPLRELLRDEASSGEQAKTGTSGIARCSSCGKTPLDAVMLDALMVLQKSGLRSENDCLRSVGTPLVTFGYPLAFPPRLGPRSLIIVGEHITRAAAETITSRIPEIKGVILSRGGVPGLRDHSTGPVENALLSGCDLRADVVQSLFGELVIYKSQAKIHIEFPRQNAPKMRILEELSFKCKIDNVVDGLAGPGTLGLMCVLAGARRVVLNDAWLPAVQNILLNLEANRKILGIEEIEHPEVPMAVVGKEPVLVARARGVCEIEVYHGDLTRLFTRAKPSGLCLIDHFPGSRTKDLEDACRCCDNVVIV
jgi:hypothetical protein